MNIRTGWILLAVCAAATFALVWCENSRAQMPPMYAAIVPPKAPVEAVAAAKPACLPTPYYPVCRGQVRQYVERQIVTAGIVAKTWEIIDVQTSGPPPAGPILTYYTGISGGCADDPGMAFFNEEWSFNGYPSPRAYYSDSIWITPDGRKYVGEGHGADIEGGNGFVQVLSAGEPILTLNPVAGEAIATTYEQSYTGCTGAMKPFKPVPFNTVYHTLRHVDYFTDADGWTWHDVWLTSLVEWTTAPGDQRYYLYAFAKAVGLVQLDCFSILPLTDSSCNRRDTLMYKAGP